MKDLIKICPKCDELTCFLLPDFDFEKGLILDTKSCPTCKVKTNENKSS